jgi:BirA family transcriptional regulator, biotin operon repressor / biotin---[acetyl-CoA-carboxylase] ligase
VSSGGPPLGRPRLHLRSVGSTNQRARELAAAGAPHGALVTAAEQTAGRGRQGRRWVAPPGRALLMSLVLREWPRLLPLAAGVAVAEECGPDASIKWPNDVLVEGGKVAGILAEGRPREGWIVLGVGFNVALRTDDLPAELRPIAGGLGRPPDMLEPSLTSLLDRLERWLRASAGEILDAVRSRDALAGRQISWEGGRGVAAGIDREGRLLVETVVGRRTLAAGEVHLGAPARAPG